MSKPAASPTPLKVGVLLCRDVQLLDLAAVDLLAMLTPTYLGACKLPDNVVALGRELTFRYIVDKVKGADGVTPAEAHTTAFLDVKVTDTLDSVDSLDILFIPGPEPSYIPSAETVAFLQKHVPLVKAVLIVCSGILPAAFSGILTNKRATAPLGLLPVLRDKLPNVEWVAQRWTTDEEKKIWTSGSVTNGTDMVAAYLKERFNPELAKLVCALADVGDREQEYPEWQLNMKLW